MATQIQLGDITIEVVQKKIKNLHLTVHPPDGRVRIAAPLHLDADTIRIYAISKLDWIKKHRRKIQEQPREAPRDFLDRESHYVWGKRYLLEVIEEDTPPAVQLGHGKLRLTLRPGINTARREAILAAWYRNLLKEAIPPLIAAWEPRLGVSVAGFSVRHMKTKWGSCTPATRTIRLNTELAKKPPACLEYVVVHEMVHLLEPSHNKRFHALMDHHLPTWPHLLDTLNQLPIRHEEWAY
jgi:predicted metal-dependent hydrolase